MFSIIRKQFLNWRMGEAELDALTDVWLGWHQAARAADGRNLRGYHSVSARLLGIPRRDRDALLRTLRQRFDPAGATPAEVDASDPDSVTVTTPFRDFTEPCSLGHWLRTFANPAYEGLALMLRLSVHDWRGEPTGSPVAGGTVVLVGLLEGQALLLKAIWPAGVDRGMEGWFEKTVWPEEASFVRYVRERLRTGTVMPGGPNLFAPAVVQRRQNFLLRLYFRTPEAGRLSSFLGRVGFHLAVLLAAVGLWAAFPKEPRALVAAGFFAVLSLWSLVYVVGRQAREVGAYHRRMSEALRKAFTRPFHFEAVDLAERGAAADPNARKYARDLEDAGLRHLGDIYHEPAAPRTVYTRVFAVPGQPTYVLLNLMYSTEKLLNFPAKAFYLINTYLDDDRRVTTINEGSGFRRSLNPRVTLRLWPEIDHPVDLLAKHRQVVDRKLAEGCRLAPVMDLPALLRLMEKEHVDQGERLRRYGYYSWGAAVRQSFRLVRREYRE